MSLALAFVLVVLGVVLVMFVRRRKRGDEHAAAETSAALDAWLPSALEAELAGRVLATMGSAGDQRKRLAKTLRGDPDPELVGAIENAVKSVDLEYIRYPHEAEVEVTMRVSYENGETSTAKKRLAWDDVPRAVRDDFERKATSRVFRPWDFPWARAS